VVHIRWIGLSSLVVVATVTLPFVQADDNSVVTYKGQTVEGAQWLTDFHMVYGTKTANKQDRDVNRKTVEDYYRNTIGDENVKLYAEDGVKEIANYGWQWSGKQAQIINNKQNMVLSAGWTWKYWKVWDTQDPTVFWAEADGGTPGLNGQPPDHGHYIDQFVVVDGKIKLYREWLVEIKTATSPDLDK
jgi:hypothetical protein